MERFVNLAAAAVLAALLSVEGYALAQTAWYTPGGSGANGAVQMKLNSSGQAVPLTVSQVSAGAGQYALGVVTATGLTPPAGATSAYICAEGAAVRYKDDGATPTASSGIPIASGACITYSGPLSAVKFIQETSTATLDVTYYE